MSILEIIELVAIAAFLIAAVVYTLVMGVKNKWFSKIKETITTAIVEAEIKFPESGSGEKKKEYVLGKVEDKCKELGIPYKLILTLANTFIDTLIGNYNTIAKSDTNKTDTTEKK